MMAILQDEATAAPFDAFHFDAGAFDALIAAHGSAAQLRPARQCACWQKMTGAPDPSCTLCYPFGFIWDAPIDTKVFGPNRKPMRRPDAAGTYQVGDAFFSLPTSIVVPYGSRLILPQSLIVADDTLEKGQRNTIRYSHVVQAMRADYVTRNPPTGHPYETVQHVLPIEGVDGGSPVLRITGRDVEWIGGSVADGTRYVVQFQTYAEYMLLDPQDRNEGGAAMPYRYLGRRLDFVVHPQTGKLSY